MADTWGAMTLRVQEMTRAPGHVNLSERPLVPDPTAATSVPQSVVVGTGRQRRRFIIRGWALLADFASLEADYYALTARTLALTDGTSLTALIERLSDGTMRPGVTDRLFYTATFMEK